MPSWRVTLTIFWRTSPEADRRVAEPAALHLLDDQLARITRTDYEHLLAARDDAARRPLDQRPCEQPCARYECEQDEPVQHRDRARQPHLVDRRGEVDGQAC